MKSWRFFVTSAFILATAAILACTAKTEKRSAQVIEGNQQIRAASAAQNGLLSFKISLTETSFDWNKLSKSERQVAKEKLAEYVAAVTRTFEIDAKKGLYVTKKEVLQKQLDGAMALQKSLENFERTYGENFEPQKPKDHA